MENRQEKVTRESSNPISHHQEGSLGQIIQDGINDDPVLSYLYDQRKVIITTVLLLAFAYYAYLRFEESFQAKMANAGGLYSELNEAYAQYEDEAITDKKEKDKLLNTIKQKINVLKTSAEPYSSMALAYEAMLALDAGEVSKAKEFVQSKLSSEIQSFYVEVSALALLKKLILIEAEKEFATLNLKKIAKDGNFVNVSAYKSLEGVVTLEELNLIKGAIIAKHPEFQSDLE